MPRGHRSTPAGEHRPVLLDEVLHALTPSKGPSLSMARSAGRATVELLQAASGGADG